MSNKKKLWFKSVVISIFLGGLIGVALYFFSNQFFEQKKEQTMVRSAELGESKTASDSVLSIGKKVPNLLFQELLNDESYVLDSDSSPIIIINFWASWCEPCVEEFSSFSRLISKFNGQISFVGISEDYSLEEAKEFLKAFTSDFKGLENIYFGYDQEKQFSNKYGILALPETFIVRKGGELLKRVSGFEQWDQPHVYAFFKNLLKNEGVIL